MNPLDLQHQVRQLVEPSIERLGYELVAVEWLAGQQGRILRLSIDGPSGITPEDCAAVSEAVSPVLDEADPIALRYHLEVSSPGIDRPVQLVRDFARFSGHRSKIKLIEGPPRRRYTGTLRGVEGDEVLIEVDGTEHRIALDTIERAHLVLDLDEYQKLAEARHDDQ